MNGWRARLIRLVVDLVLERIVKHDYLALLPPPRLAAADDLTIPGGHHDPKVGPQPCVRWAAVSGEPRVRAQKREVSAAERARRAIATEAGIIAAQQRAPVASERANAHQNAAKQGTRKCLLVLFLLTQYMCAVLSMHSTQQAQLAQFQTDLPTARCAEGGAR